MSSVSSSSPMTESAPGPFSPVTAWYTVGMLALMYGVAYLDRTIMSIMVGPIRADLGISDFQVSLLLGIGFAGFYALFGLPIGLLVDRTSRRRVIYWGMTIWSVATMVCGVVGTYPQLLTARLAVGAGEATLHPAASSIISDVFYKRAVTLAIAVYTCGSAFGSAGSVALVGYLIGVTAHMDTIAVPLLGDMKPWRVIFLAIGLPGVVLAFLNFTFREPVRRGRVAVVRQPFSAVWHFVRSRRTFFSCHFAGFSLLQFINYAISSWMPTFMVRHYGWQISQVTPVLSLIMLVSIPGMLSIGWFVEHQFQRGKTDIHLSAYAVMVLIIAVLIAVGVASPSPWVAAGLFALAIGMLGYIAIAMAAIQLATPNEFRGQITVLFGFIMTLIGQGIGPSVPAAFTDFLFHDDKMVGWSIALTVGIASPICAALLWAGRGPMRRAVAEADAWA